MRDSLYLSGLGIGRASAAVIATQGHYDDLAIEAAFATDAGYIGLVAADKRAAATLSLLRARGPATSGSAGSWALPVSISDQSKTPRSRWRCSRIS